MELLDGTPVEMDKYYKVVTNDFMAEVEMNLTSQVVKMF